LLFVASLVLGVVLYIRLMVACQSLLTSVCRAGWADDRGEADFTENTPWHEGTPAKGCILPQPICLAAAYDTEAFAVAGWAMLQLSWTLIVLGSQLWQISRQLTTFELSNLGRYGFMGGHVVVGGPGVGGAHAGNNQALSTDGLPVHAHAHGGHGHRHGHSALGAVGALGKKLPGKLMHLVGLDLYTRGRAGAGMKRAEAASNPFDHGLRRNCEDFWTRGRTLGVDYTTLYDIPDAGLLHAKRASGEREGSASKTRTRGQYEMVPSDVHV
jgi:hypothetical protein